MLNRISEPENLLLPRLYSKFIPGQKKAATCSSHFPRQFSLGSKITLSETKILISSKGKSVYAMFFEHRTRP